MTIDSLGHTVLLFNDPRYIYLGIGEHQSIFRYDHWLEGRLIGSLIGVRSADNIDCGYRAPYGGPDVFRAAESVSNIILFLRNAINAARQTGARTLIIRARPEYHSINETSVVFALFNLGFEVTGCELAQGIDVTRYASAEHYMRALKASQCRQIRRGLRGTQIVKVETDPDWGVGYELLALNRSFRGVSLKFSLNYLLQLKVEFEDRLSMYLLQAGKRAIAAALVYRVSPRVDYVVAWGDDKTMREIAPIGTIAVHLVERAIKESVEVLDIGVSSVDGVPDDGLIAFKRHTLAASGLRLNFMKSLQSSGDTAFEHSPT